MIPVAALRTASLRLGLVLAVLGTTNPALAGTDLDNLADRHLPWRTEVQLREDVYRVLDAGWGQSVLVERDGDTSLVYTARNPGIVLDRVEPGHARAMWQHNLPPQHCGRTPCAALAGLWDADGDGDRDLVLVSRADDRSQWLIRALDTGRGDTVAEVWLAAGPDRRFDNGWDGVYTVAGVTEVATAAGPRRSFLVLATAGYDGEPRGVLAVDTGSGEVLWTHFTGAQPAIAQFACTDLDGNGHLDVVYVGAAVNNLGGRQVNGLSDDVCAVVAIGGDGRRLWTRIYPAQISGYLAVGAAGPGGGALVAVALAGLDGPDAVLEVLAGGDGRTLATAPLPSSPCGLKAVATDGGLDLYLGSAADGVLRYRYDGALRRTARARSTGVETVQATVDLLPRAGVEILAWNKAGRVHVLGPDLKPLAHFADPLEMAQPYGVVTLPDASGVPTLVVQSGVDDTGVRFTLHPNPRPVPWGALSLLPVAGGSLWYLRRRRRGRTSAATRRELRLQLLARLELSGHGAIGALRSLRRLVWLLDARGQAAGPSPDLDARLQELEQECRQHMLPDLAGTLELAGLAGCAPAGVAQARDAHQRIGRLLDTPDDDGRRELREAAGLLEGAMMSLRRGLEDEFRADLTVVTARVLAAHEDAISAAGVTVATTGLDAPLWCRVDADELVFVVDNLVENALRAMAASSRRELDLAASAQPGQILLQVTDTGCGIAPDDWEAVLETRQSSREGGGLGLPESRRRLRKHGGSLAVTASQAGTGTTLTMSVAPARAQESVKPER